MANDRTREDILNSVQEDFASNPVASEALAALTEGKSVDYLEGYVTALQDTLATRANEFMASASAEAMAVELLSLSLEAKKAASGGEDSKIYGD